MNILVVIQARTGSSRLPNKVLLPLAGRPLLERLVQRVQAASAATRFEIMVATTLSPEDDSIQKLCREIGTKCFRGHVTDLLDRHYRAGLQEKADAVVKIPSDCPLIGPAVIDRVIGHYVANRDAYDFVSNLHPPSYPDGNDVEVMSFQSLEHAWSQATRPFEREHTTPFIWESRELFRIGNVRWETGLDYSMSHRWTIDYPEDYLFIKSVYDELWTEPCGTFGIGDVLDLLALKPDLRAINEMYVGVNWYRHHLDGLRTKSAKDTRIPTGGV
jgi:spore coat polysaccharide biosynthesis protein SpsF